ncbi:MAG TPA: NAD(P)H-dependent oxidoreductase [Bryobacteraceae bacterium]|nr:NAD(P)H-dependent oxidoreductase [Bryobacteraceae bacterium]
MPVLLHIDSSPMGESSISRHLTREFVRRWRLANPQGKVVSRDLAVIAIPGIDAEWICANLTPGESRTRRQKDVLAFSTELTDELLQADECVIGVPMHNWGPSSSFKLWVDQIVRLGRTIVATPAGLKGTLDKKRITFILAAGRRYGPGSPEASANHLEPWLRTFFANLGVTDMQFILADGAADVTYGKIDRAVFLAPYLDAVQSLFAEVPGSQARR